MERAAVACGINADSATRPMRHAEEYPVRMVHTVQSAALQLVKGVEIHGSDTTFCQRLGKVGGIAVLEAEGLVKTGGEGKRAVSQGRAWTEGPEAPKAKLDAPMGGRLVVVVAGAGLWRSAEARGS